MRIVLDASVFISGLVFGGKPQAVIEIVLRGECELVVSEPILEEVARKLVTKFGWRNPAVALAVKTIRESATLVNPRLVVTDCVDPDDNIFLECADAARADYLVTGNQKHFPRFWKKTKVITPREFISLVAPHLISQRSS